LAYEILFMPLGKEQIMASTYIDLTGLMVRVWIIATLDFFGVAILWLLWM
jgi:hypothetical protein